MLPFELSTNICSLKPQADRLVLSALLEIDHQGDIVGAGIHRGRDPQRGADDVHQRPPAAGRRCRAARALCQPLVARFELMQELALMLNRKRVRRGSIDFDLPEPLIEFDEWGAMTGVTRAPRNIAHRLIEEFMLAANEAVAAHLEQHVEAVDLPHPREARPQARDGVRGGGGALRLLAGGGRDSGEAIRVSRTGTATARKKRREIDADRRRDRTSRRGIIRSWWRRSRASRKSAS